MALQASKETSIPRPRAGRIESLKNPPRFRVSPKPTRPPKAAAQCKNPECNNSDIKEEDGKVICISCGFVLDDVQITQELTFGEAANGAAVVQGVYVGANDENARNQTLGASKIAGGLDSRQITERNGHQYIAQFLGPLRLNNTHKDRAMQVYKLAMGNNFIQGRSTRHVAAVCLYIGCRMDSECKVMLIDFAELLNINVFKLGQVYSALVDEIGFRGDPKNDKKPSEIFDVNPENLIQRFAQDLEFGKDEYRIVHEAVQILKRLNRDWIVTGRRPAGVCAAALILAARMNNYRRTVREVVYTAKVCDITIHKRLEEFKFTESSKLTVEEFRHHGLNLEKDHDPPAYYEQFLKKKRRKKRRHDDGEENEVENAPEDDVRQSREDMSPGAQARADRAAMPPPSEPIDPALLGGDEIGQNRHLTALAAAVGNAKKDGAEGDEESDSTNENNGGTNGTQGGQEDSASGNTTAEKRKRLGKPKGAKNKPLPVLTESAIQHQNEIEAEVEDYLRNPETVATAESAHKELESTPAPTFDDDDDNGDRNQETPSNHKKRNTHIPITEEIDPAEFENDIEVMDCLLSPAEIAIKERIWVSENAEYLRDQQRRKIKRDLAEKAGTAPVKKRRVRRRGRMGDGNWRDGENVPGSPAESVNRMLGHRGYSKKINYNNAFYLFAGSDARKAARESTERENGTSEERSGTPTPGPSSSQNGTRDGEKPDQVTTADVGLPTPQASGQNIGSDKNAPIEIGDNSDTETDDDDDDDLGNPEDYFEEGEELEQPEEEQYEFGDEDEGEEL